MHKKVEKNENKKQNSLNIFKQTKQKAAAPKRSAAEIIRILDLGYKRIKVLRIFLETLFRLTWIA